MLTFFKLSILDNTPLFACNMTIQKKILDIYADREDLDQLVHLHCIIRAYAFALQGNYILPS